VFKCGDGSLIRSVIGPKVREGNIFVTWTPFVSSKQNSNLGEETDI